MTDIYQEKDFQSITRRKRHRLLTVGLAVIILIGLVFCVINYHRGLYSLAVVELAVAIFCTALLFFIRRPSFLVTGSYIFIATSFFLGQFAFYVPGSHPTVFVWAILGPMLSFFLLGKKEGLLVSAIFIVSAIGILFYKTFHVGIDLPVVALGNIVMFLLCGTIMTYYYESTRHEFEKTLMQDIRRRIEAEEEK